MSQTCLNCPCPSACLRWEIFCAWAAEDPPNPINLRHICSRSALGDTPSIVAPTDTVAQAVQGAAGRPAAAEALALARRMRACPYRSQDASCGCSGGRCGLRRGGPVSHIDCFDCLRRYPDPDPE